VQNAEVLKTLRSLVALNESLKKQEQDFRQTCKKQLQELQGMIHALKNQSPDDDEVPHTHHRTRTRTRTRTTAQSHTHHRTRTRTTARAADWWWWWRVCR
jgi:hypothetical protein